MKFLNRNKEISRLRKSFKSDGFRLIVIYGRRRLGKTRLLQQIAKDDDIYFIADQRESIVQIQSLAKQIAVKNKDFDRVSYPDWLSLFISLAKWTDKRRTLFIDEFPYLVKNKPELPSIIQKLIDNEENLPFNLVLCGSSQQMMQKMVIDQNAALYGRAHEIIKINPMNIYWLKEALACSYEDAIEEYSVWGGVPRYWEIRQKAGSFQEAIINQVFDFHGLLHEEPLRLFLDDTRDSVQMHTLISIIASGASRLSEIGSRIGKPVTQLNRPLQRLIELGYIKREIPFGLSKRNTKKSLYKVADPFMHFYYKFVIPEKTSLELGHTEQIYDHVLKESFSDYCSEIWEELCRLAVPALMKSTLFTAGERWWGNDLLNKPSEIDIVAESRNKKEILLGEAKWSSSRNILAVMKKLDHKSQFLPFTKGKTIHKVLFLKSKPAKVPEDYIIFTPKDVVEALL